jgi:hypothetical protein
MKRNVATYVLGTMAMLLAVTPIVVSAATPNPTSAVVIERVFNDCPISVVTTVNAYPASISIKDDNLFSCLGFANLHVWRFSTDGATEASFDNDANYSFCADLTESGTGSGEAGLMVAPWWSEADGYFNVRSTDGEVACFSGRLPFYSFSGSAAALRYVKGTTVHLEIVYSPNGLSDISPATIEYRYTDGTGLYSSGALPFDSGNLAENPPHGIWGQLNAAKVGGHLKYFLSQSPQQPMTVTWNNICYSNNSQPTPTAKSTWGAMKALYR